MANAPYSRDGATVSTDVDKLGLDRKFIGHFQASAANAIAESATSVHAAITLTASAQTVTAAITSPAIPRNVSITGSAAGIAGNVTVTGTNYNGDTITEVIALSGTSTVVGNKAFATVVSIALPAKTNSSGDTVSIGTGSKLGLPVKLAHNTCLIAFLDSTKESTAPTIATSATVLESNTITLNSALSGKVVDAYFLI
jgi:hypothetical protein